MLSVYAIGKPFTVWEPDTEEPAQVQNDIFGRPLVPWPSRTTLVPPYGLFELTTTSRAKPSPKAHFEECQVWSMEKRVNIVTVKSLGREKEADQGYIKCVALSVNHPQLNTPGTRSTV